MAASAINPVPQQAYPQHELTIPYREFLSKSGATQDMAFGPNMTRASMTLTIDFTQLEDAIKQIVGYSTRGGGGAINRHLPIQHTNLYWMWAKSIQHVRFGKPTGTDPIVEKSQRTRYNFCDLTVEFWQPTYATTSDGAVTGEWGRYVTVIGEPAGEFMSRPRGNFKWTDGGPQNGATFQGTKSMYVPKKRMKLIWHQLPEKGLFPNLTAANPDFTSPNLDFAMGKVNNAVWAGFPIETILAEAWAFEPVAWPCSATALGLDAGFNVSRLWDAHISILHFDPPYGNAVNRGHNLHPQQDNLWWKVSASSGAELPYRATNMANMWKMN